MKGIIQFFLADKGYGYIRVVATREEFYVHKKSLLGGWIPQKGELVLFELKEDRHGMHAINVRPA